MEYYAAAKINEELFLKQFENISKIWWLGESILQSSVYVTLYL